MSTQLQQPNTNKQPSMNTPFLAPTIPPVPASSSTPRRISRRLLTILLILIILMLLSGSLGAYFVFFRPLPPVAGQAAFGSDENYDLTFHTSQGVSDTVEIDLQNIPEPQQGKSYYAWLLGDQNPLPDVNNAPTSCNPSSTSLITLPLLLTNNLQIDNSHTAKLLFTGTPGSDDLLATGSRILITEEPVNSTSTTPSTNPGDWRYYLAIPQVHYGPNIMINNKSYQTGAIDQIRPLFFRETSFVECDLPGGLDTWLFRNAEKLLEKIISARDDLAEKPLPYDQIHDKFRLILQYLDGIHNLHIDDLPNGAVNSDVADSFFSQVGFLTVNPGNQGLQADGTDHRSTNPIGMIPHILEHLQALLNAPDKTQEMQNIANRAINALNNAQLWLQLARQDAKKLYAMSYDQLQQAQSQMDQPQVVTSQCTQAFECMDDLIAQITNAYMGRLDPATNQTQDGILQAHQVMQQLRTFSLVTVIPPNVLNIQA